MRLLALDCKQVGHWDSPLQLALSPRITVVLGDNEAGKSTLRRALRALLFGPDKALAAPLLVGGFEMSAQLDMGATGACTLHRKGRTLQAPLPEVAVALLDSANAGRFAGLFDLSHENLSPQDQAFLKAEGFECLREADVPLTIREHARKYQYIVTHATLWRRGR